MVDPVVDVEIDVAGPANAAAVHVGFVGQDHGRRDR